MSEQTWKRRAAAVLLAGAMTVGAAAPATAEEASGFSREITSSPIELYLYLDRPEVVVNHEIQNWEQPLTVINGSSYVPARKMGEVLGYPVEWNEAERMAKMVLPNGVEIRIDPFNKSVFINEYWQHFDEVAANVNGNLMVKFSWLMTYLGIEYQYDSELRRIHLIYVPHPAGVITDTGNSRPVAKFVTDKSVYKIGEPVRFTDLSYDPDAEGLPVYEWKGKQDAYFKAGKHEISLQVKDPHGNTSDVYKRTIEVTRDVYFTELEYQIYRSPVGSFIKANWPMLYAHFLNRPQLPKTKVEYMEGRKLLLSDSPETFYEEGVLYRDVINGQGRLYADHLNGMKETAEFAIVARNTTNRSITVTTTRKGEVYPSIYANMIGHQASVDFLMNEPISEKLVIPAGQTRIYKRFPDFRPGQGVNLFYDLETDGEVEFSFVAATKTTGVLNPNLKPLPFQGHIRGSFPVSEIRWEVDGSQFEETSALTFGAPDIDPWVEGYDVFRQQAVQADANFGVLYKIRIHKPKKSTILFLPRAGVFKGPIKIDGEFVLLPDSGVILPFERLQIVHRTTGEEDYVDIEFTPPAGSAFPVDLLFVPLDERAK